MSTAHTLANVTRKRPGRPSQADCSCGQAFTGASILAAASQQAEHQKETTGAYRNFIPSTVVEFLPTA